MAAALVSGPQEELVSERQQKYVHKVTEAARQYAEELLHESGRLVLGDPAAAQGLGDAVGITEQ